MIAVTIFWEVFRRALLDQLLPREKRDVKVDEFINLSQECMSMQEYFLKFTKFSKYAYSLVSNPKDEMIRFVMGVSDDVVEECHSAILDDNMDISRLIVNS